jgi:hypothetical protein
MPKLFPTLVTFGNRIYLNEKDSKSCFIAHCKNDIENQLRSRIPNEVDMICYDVNEVIMLVTKWIEVDKLLNV